MRSRSREQGAARCARAIRAITMLVAVRSAVEQALHRTYPYTPYPDLSTPIPSYLTHSQAPNAKPEPSRLSNALPNIPTPLHLVNAFPT